MPPLALVQPEPVSPCTCIAVAKGGLTTAEKARKQVRNTEIEHQISRHRITSDRPRQER